MPLILGLLGKACMSFGLKLLTSLASEKFIEWAFFKAGEAVVKSTETPHDDEWFEAIKEAYKNSKGA